MLMLTRGACRHLDVTAQRSLDAAVLSADGQTVYTYSTWECAGSDCVGVIALETTTGKELWRTKAINKLVYTGYLTPGIIIKDDVLYYSVTKNVTTVSVVACSTTDGSLLWQWLSPYHKNGACLCMCTCMCTCMSMCMCMCICIYIYVLHVYGQLTAHTGPPTKLSAQWHAPPVHTRTCASLVTPHRPLGAYGQQWICLMTAISSSNLLYAGHTGNKMSSINASSGQTVDTIVFDTGTFNATNLEFYKCNIPTLSHDEQTLYLSLYYLEKHRTNLYGVSANFNTTIVRESYYPYDGISTSVVVSKDDSRVFFGGVSGNIYCVQAGGVQWPPPSPKESNSTIWIFQTWGEVYSVGILDKEEDLFYVGSNDGHFYAINAETGQCLVTSSRRVT